MNPNAFLSLMLMICMSYPNQGLKGRQFETDVASLPFQSVSNVESESFLPARGENDKTKHDQSLEDVPGRTLGDISFVASGIGLLILGIGLLTLSTIGSLAFLVPVAILCGFGFIGGFIANLKQRKHHRSGAWKRSVAAMIMGVVPFLVVVTLIGIFILTYSG
ncbi:MAG: hypothetical protein NWR72_16585 [Bacteroidia bacterium]|nr:hypothetical protein [Bacteroidia bacterium]